MSVVYSDSLKNNRMQAVSDAIGTSGTLEVIVPAVLDPQSHKILVPAVTLAIWQLDGPPSVDGDTLQLAFVENEVSTIAAGQATLGVIKNALGFTIVSGLRCGSSFPCEIIFNGLGWGLSQRIRLAFATLHHNSGGNNDAARMRMTLRNGAVNAD